MKSIYRIAAAMLLIFVVIFNTVSCDLIKDYVSGALGGPAGGQDTSGLDFYFDEPTTVEISVGEKVELQLVRDEALTGEIIWTSSHSCATVDDGLVTGVSVGKAVIKAELGDRYDRLIVDVRASGGSGSDNDDDDGRGDTVIVPDEDEPITSDPYVNVDKDEFYASYTPATSYMDSYYRSQHNLMSGSIYDQDQEPSVSDFRPTYGGKYVRNNVYLFSEDGNTYYVVDCYGEIAFEIYKGGAYVVLEEVAAYVFAFGEPPANHSASKKTKPTQSEWGIYLRVNNTKFSGDTSKYPYEPVLPRISGCGGDLTYYEMDIGTTGTDCDPSYDVRPYNNGKSITRGAARIVYSCKDRNGDSIIDLDERYVFYTYNHYNDFQEYLNYLGGWGDMFGNITGGGSLSSKTNYNPTPYVDVYYSSLKEITSAAIIYYYVPKNEFVA